jgi:FkbM family methyltransferase
MRVPGDDHIGRIIADGAPYEKDLLDYAAALVAPGDLILDVGANIGNHSIFLSVVAGAQVIAVEANPRAAAYLRTNVELNRLTDRIAIFEHAAGAEPGNASIDTTVEGNLGATALRHGYGPIAVTTLDVVAAERPIRLVKIDIEGDELDALRGMQGVLRQDRPHLIVEAHDELRQREIDDFLGPYGYTRRAESLAWTPTFHWFPAAKTS